MSCTHTALAAISGCDICNIDRLLIDAAAECDRHIPPFRENYSRRDWLRVVEMIGGRFRQTFDRSDLPPMIAPASIDQWVARAEPALTLVQCEWNSPMGTKGHVFATQGPDIVDTYTEGRCVTFTEVPLDFAGFRVTRTYHISPK